MAVDPLSRPMPGESLTQPTTDGIFKPSKIDDIDTALFSTVDTIRNNKSLHSDLMNMIEAGVDLESIANVITFGSFSQGQYSPDIAMQLSPLLGIWMHAEAREAGIDSEDIIIMNFPKDKTMGSISPDDIVSLMKRKNPDKHKRVQKGAASTELDSFFKQLRKDINTEPAEPSGSFMDMGNANIPNDVDNANITESVPNDMGNVNITESVPNDMGNVNTQDTMEQEVVV